MELLAPIIYVDDCSLVNTSTVNEFNMVEPELPTVKDCYHSAFVRIVTLNCDFVSQQESTTLCQIPNDALERFIKQNWHIVEYVSRGTILRVDQRTIVRTDLFDESSTINVEICSITVEVS